MTWGGVWAIIWGWAQRQATKELRKLSKEDSLSGLMLRRRQEKDLMSHSRNYPMAQGRPSPEVSRK